MPPTRRSTRGQLAAKSGHTRNGSSADSTVKRSTNTDQDKDFNKFVRSYRKRRVEEREKITTMQKQIDDKSQEIDSVRDRNRELNAEIAALHTRKDEEKAELQRTAETVKQQAVASMRRVWQRHTRRLEEENTQLKDQHTEQTQLMKYTEEELWGAKAEFCKEKQVWVMEKGELERKKEQSEANNKLWEKEYGELVEKADAYQNELVYLKKMNAHYCTENARLFEEIAALRPGSQARRKPAQIEWS